MREDNKSKKEGKDKIMRKSGEERRRTVGKGRERRGRIEEKIR